MRETNFAKARCHARALILVLVFSTNLLAQNLTSVQGRVTDEQGGGIGAADVRLRSREGRQLIARTNRTGTFEFTNLKSGDYLIEVKAPGFSVLTSEVSLRRGERKELSLQLRIAEINASVIVTATGTPQRADEVGKAVSILDSQAIEARHQPGLAEALRGIPGLRVQQQGSPGALTTLRLRGQRSFDTAILFDGLRVRDAADINGSAASLVSDLVPVSTDRVEILHGSGSSIYGTNAIGGVVNIVPVAGAGALHFEVGAEAGGLATFRERVRASGGGKRFGVAIGIDRLDVRKGVDGDDAYGDSAAAGRFEFNPTSSMTIAGNVYGTVANARLNDPPFSLPAAFAGTQRYPRAVAGVNYQPDFNNPDQGRRNRLLVGSVRLTQQISNKLSYTVAYQRVSSNRRNYNGPNIDARFASFYPFGEFEFLNVNRGTTDTLDGRINIRLGRANLATVGIEYEREAVFQESIPSFSAFNKTTDRESTIAVFGQDQFSLFEDRLQVALGIRGQFYKIRAADRPDFLQVINAKRSLTGDGAFSYLIRSKGTKLRAHIGNGFRSPSLFERFGAGTFPGLGLVRFGDPTLRAEQSISLDGGIDQRLARDRVLLGATYFYTHLQRSIAFTSFAVDPLGLGRFGGFVNQPGGIARGLESSIEATLLRGTQVRGSYTYTNSDRSVEAQGLQQEYVIPRHLFGLNLGRRYRSFMLNFNLNRTGSYIAPVFENTLPFRPAELRFAGYTKADLFGSYERRLSERVAAVLFAGADNLFNRRYFENGFRAPRIVGRGGVTFRF